MSTIDDVRQAVLLRGFTPDEQRRLATCFTLKTFPAESRVVEEGARDRDLHVLLTGTARFIRNGLILSSVTPGEAFGELALLAHSPRAATVQAVTDVTTAMLSPEAYARLGVEEPALASKLLELMVLGVGNRLTDMTDNVRLLLRERSLPRQAHVQVMADGASRQVATGTRLYDVLPRELNGHRVVAGLLGRKPVSLMTALGSDCTVTSLTTQALEGQRIYQQSLTLLLLEAAARVAPEVEVRVRDSLGGAMRLDVRGAEKVDVVALAPLLEAEMRRLAGCNQLLRQELWTVDEAVEHFQRVGWHDVVDFLRTWRRASVPMATYGSVVVLQNGPLIHATGELLELRVLAAGSELILVDQPLKIARIEQMARRATQGATPHERWLGALGISNVGAFNRACIDGDVAQMIRVSEGFHEKSVSRIADGIAARAHTTKLVCIAGPSSSGKTTFIKRLMVQLQVEGIHPIGLSMDDYYLDREKSPRDEHGEFDFEVLEALDMPLLRSDLLGMMQGKTVKTARYDFKAGRSIPGSGPEVTLGPSEVLLLEGIHGLNPSIFTPPSADMVFRVFVCPRAQLAFDRMTRIHASDVRLLRRIVRDRHSRGTSAADNIMRWPSVRAGEQKHIFPFESYADATFDSSLIYELSVLKVYAERYLLEVPHDHPAYTVAYRLLALLDRVVTIYPDHVPPTSFLREFIGGSGFEY